MSPTSVPESTGGRSGDEKPAELFLPVGKQVGDLSEPRQGDENSEDFEKEGENDGRQVIEEIESLCMNCHENVRIGMTFTNTQLIFSLGSHEAVSYEDTFFPRTHRHLILL